MFSHSIKKQRTDRLTVFFLTLSILTALALPLSALMPGEEDFAVYHQMLRLHVIADSDEEADQEIKLAVRDAVILKVAALTDGLTDFHEACSVIKEHLDEIQTSAQTVVSAHGSQDKVAVTLTRESYPTRSYDGLTLPAGNYQSLQIKIGKAEGKNWWCVLFPQLCTNLVTATKSEPVTSVSANVGEKLVETGFTPSQIELLTGKSPKVVVKFRLLEWIGQLFS